MADLKRIYQAVVYIDNANTKTRHNKFVKGLAESHAPRMDIRKSDFIEQFSKHYGIDDIKVNKILKSAVSMEFIDEFSLAHGVVKLSVNSERGLDMLDHTKVWKWYWKKGLWREIVNQENKLINLIAPLITGVIGGVLGALIIRWLIK